MPRETTYAPRFRRPDWLTRAEEQTIECPVYRDGSLVSPDAVAPATPSSVTVTDENGDEVVSAEAVTIASSVAGYTIPAASLAATRSYSDRWMIVWSLYFDGVLYRFRRDAALVRSRLYPSISDGDLTERHTELSTWRARDATSYQGYIDAAWDDVLLRLMEDGRYPYLILSPWSLRSVHLARSLTLVFRDFAASTDPQGKYTKLAELYAAEYDKAWSRVVMRYDADQDGQIGSDEQMVGAEPTIMLVPPQRWTRGIA